MRLVRVVFCLVFTVVSIQSFSTQSSERRITILATNDIHGATEASTDPKKGKVGGFDFWSGVVNAIRKGAEQDSNPHAVLVVDGGDQFQGTLLSNINEGALLFTLMRQIGYQAIVPGNHDYDFGPSGWEVDQSKDPSKRLEALAHAAQSFSTPLVAANTYLKSSIRDAQGNPVAVKTKLCGPLEGNTPIDWSSAQQPAFIKPFQMVDAAGARVALIGLDDSNSQAGTTADNVEDLCFADEAETYIRVRTSLEGQADIFVLVVHKGDGKPDKFATELAEKITRIRNHMVDAIVSAHSHFTYNFEINGVPLIQSGANGLAFGRIDLAWDADRKKIIPERTKSFAGISLYHDTCDPDASSFCKVLPSGEIAYEGTPVTPDPVAAKLISNARTEIQSIAGQTMAIAETELTRDRINESPMLNIFTDLLRESSKADVSFLNTGGVRDNLKAGNVRFEDLFRVFPFANRVKVIGPVSREKLLEVVQFSIQTCGSYGAILPSGLRVQYQRQCSTDGTDSKARLVRVTTLNGQELFPNPSPDAPREFSVATLDFIVTKGEGMTAFVGVPEMADLGILRNVFRDRLAPAPAHWKNQTDGRWKNLSDKKDAR